ncbi:MAG: hypothetical protein ACXQTI_01715 [Candidatus Nezhaarchaeales archaeon]
MGSKLKKTTPWEEDRRLPCWSYLKRGRAKKRRKARARRSREVMSELLQKYGKVKLRTRRLTI